MALRKKSRADWDSDLSCLVACLWEDNLAVQGAQCDDSANNPVNRYARELKVIIQLPFLASFK